MKVKELIILLQQLDDNAEVGVEFTSQEWDTYTECMQYDQKTIPIKSLQSFGVGAIQVHLLV